LLTSFVSLEIDLGNCFDKTLAQLSPAQRARIQGALPSHESWDTMSSDDRRGCAEAWDTRNRPLTEAELKRLQKHVDDLATARSEEDYWNSRLDASAGDAEVKQKNLKAVLRRLSDLNAKQESLRGDYLPAACMGDVPVASPPPSHWKMKVQAEAAAHMKSLRQSGANPTVHSIVARMQKWCADNNVKTDGGIVPSAGYLRTHVLGGKHWSAPR
jgi:hypothetical protein